MSTGTPTHTVVVVVGGGPLSARADDAFAALGDDGAGGVLVIAADSGLDRAIAAGISPHQLVGDLDSLSAGGRMWAYAHGVTIDEHPPAKDETDTELAIAAALAVDGAGALLVLGGLDPTVDDRLDHLLGTLVALGNPRLAALESVRAVLGTSEVVVVHPGHTVHIALDAGRTFSLLALHGTCQGVHVTGARWPLVDATLHAHQALGVSNVAEGDTTVGVAAGVLTVVIP